MADFELMRRFQSASAIHNPRLELVHHFGR
jgi:hypothetical protein